MSVEIVKEFKNVTLVCKANVYFGGRVVSHSIVFEGGERKTVGLIYPGTFHFNTAASERMEIIAGSCRVRIAETVWQKYSAGEYFDVPGESSFDIEVVEGLTEYICSFG